MMDAINEVCLLDSFLSVVGTHMLLPHVHTLGDTCKTRAHLCLFVHVRYEDS